eukprot:3109896-Pyramimonas_sp.AAC.1
MVHKNEWLRWSSPSSSVDYPPPFVLLAMEYILSTRTDQIVDEERQRVVLQLPLRKLAIWLTSLDSPPRSSSQNSP